MSGERSSLLWPTLLLALITFGVFSPILRNDFAGIWDDDKYIANNEDYNPPTLKKLVHYWVPPPKDEFFVPVLYSTWGFIAMGARSVSSTGVVTFHALPYHALSISAHIGSVIFAFLILVQLSRSRVAAFFGAILFALHPVQVEAVAWASTAYTPMCAMFCLLAIWQFIAATDADKSRRHFAIHYAIASLAFLIAMLTKPAALSAPLIIAAIEIGLRKRSVRKLLLPLGVWMVVAIILVSITRSSVPAATVKSYPPLFPPVPRLVIALNSVAFYLYRVVSPFDFCIDYGRTPGWVLGDQADWLLYIIPTAHWLIHLIPIGLFAAAILLRKRFPAPATVVGVFLAALLPTLGLVPFTFQSFSTVADRYAYLGLFAVAILVALAIGKLPRRLIFAAAFCLAVLLGILTVREIPRWKNEWTLFSKTLKANPQSLIVASNLQFMLTPAEQSKCTLSALELEEMGDRLMVLKRSKLASDVYAISVDRNPISRIYLKLARARLQTQQATSAMEAAQNAVRLAPDDPSAKSMLSETERAVTAPR